jgi:hypothetical protein
MQAVQVDRTLYISGQLGLNHLAELVPGGVERETEKVTPFTAPQREKATDVFGWLVNATSITVGQNP